MTIFSGHFPRLNILPYTHVLICICSSSCIPHIYCKSSNIPEVLTLIFKDESSHLTTSYYLRKVSPVGPRTSVSTALNPGPHHPFLGYCSNYIPGIFCALFCLLTQVVILKKQIWSSALLLKTCLCNIFLYSIFISTLPSISCVPTISSYL